MAVFRFPLEKVLRWRSAQLAAEEAKLKRLLQEQLQLQSLVSDIGAEKARLISSLEKLPDLRGGDLQAAGAYSVVLNRHSEKIAQQLARCEKDLAVRKKKYQEAQQRVQLLEELKKRRLENWRVDEMHQLETLAAESYLAGWNRDRLES